MSRPVGGASAVGCGVFGVGSLLIGVALVVWLGSIALSGSTGGSGQDGGASSTLAGGLSVTQPETGEPRSAELAVTPPTGLGERGQVSVTGTGFAPGSIVLEVCLAEPLAGTLACADDGGVNARVSERGGFDRAIEVRRVLLVGNAPYDCAVRRGACVLRTHRADGPEDQGISVPLAFAPDLPPVEAEPAPG